MPSATIKIFLVHGDPKRLRTAEISNWTGKAVAGPRSEFEGIFSRQESSSPGIYFLTGIDPETGNPALYIGEAESVGERLKAHLQRDFWNQIVFFISKDENMTKAHSRYLEGKLIEQARQVARSVVNNGQSSGAKLPESDRADLEIFLEKINQLLPVLGIELLVPVSTTPENAAEQKLLFCEILGLTARGHLTPNGFVILKDSKAVLNERASTQKYPWAHNMRTKLRDEGVLVPEATHLTFARDTDFSSASAAATVVHGGQTNGLTAWKDSQGKTLKEIESV